MSKHLSFQLFEFANHRVKLPLHALNLLLYLISILSEPVVTLSLEDFVNLLDDAVDLDLCGLCCCHCHCLCHLCNCFFQELCGSLSLKHKSCILESS